MSLFNASDSTPHPVRSGKSSSMSSSPGADNSANAANTTPSSNASKEATVDREKPRLTDKEKKNNHIASEQKRRAAIREGFDRLTELVPGIEGQGRSEGMVLKKTVDFMQLKQLERKELIEEIERRGGRVDERFRQGIDDQ